MPEENWDEDFDFQPGPSTPVKRALGPSDATKSPYSPQSAQATPVKRTEPENWDDDFADPESPKAAALKRQFQVQHPLAIDDDDEEDDAQFGFIDKDEDKTVTAKSRRGIHASPPPPVPSIPAGLVPSNSTTINTPPQPFPRSPTTSVFSVPSNRDSFAYGSSSHLALRPSLSRSSGFSNLPPSPPIHKERERRRLRKKSRPPPEGLFELVSVTDLELAARVQPADRPSTPEEPPPPQDPPIPASTPAKSPLLARIGSVKRWGTKKKTSTAPNVVDDSSFFQSAGGGIPLSPPAIERMTSGNSSLDSRPTTASSKSEVDPKLGKRHSFLRPFRNSPDTPSDKSSSYAAVGLGHAPSRPNEALSAQRQNIIGKHKRAQSSCSSLDPHNTPIIPSSSSVPNAALLPPIQLQQAHPTARVVSDSRRSVTGRTASPQAASLGRSSVPVLNGMNGTGVVPRRNSLGDLKIPSRISQNQSSLKRDLVIVKEFAASIEQLKVLQATYQSLVVQINTILDAFHAKAQNIVQPSISIPEPLMKLTRPLSRQRSDISPHPQEAYKQLASTFYTINSKYRISWECADLLIELGGTSSSHSPPTSSVSAPAVQTLATTPGESGTDTGHKGRERAITLTGDESTPTKPRTASSTWTSSSNPHDLNPRQLHLLKEMLTSHDLHQGTPPPFEPPAVDHQWRWGDAMNSTVTLPSEENSSGYPNASRDSGLNKISYKKRRTSRLGMAGIRDMLRALKREAPPPPPPPDVPPLPISSSSSLSTQSSMGSQNHMGVPQTPKMRRRAKTSSGPMDAPHSRGRDLDSRLSPAFNSSSLSTTKPSPRRPSLASIFRLGRKSQVPADVQVPVVTTADDDDWDYEAALQAISGRDGNGTIRASSGSRSKSPYLNPQASASTTSSHHLPRSIRLSNVEEAGDDAVPELAGKLARSGKDAAKKTGSVRSMPPHPLPERKLALTPENLRPLLENAKEVEMRLVACITEMRALVEAS